MSSKEPQKTKNQFIFNVQTRSPYQTASFLYNESNFATAETSNNQKSVQNQTYSKSTDFLSINLRFTAQRSQKPSPPAPGFPKPEYPNALTLAPAYILDICVRCLQNTVSP